MIGNRVDAQKAWEFHHDFDSMPSDWSFIGSGISRHAYLSPEGVVYKVGAEYENRTEVRTIHRLREKAGRSMRYRIPAANIYRVRKTKATSDPAFIESTFVVAMEYVKSNERRSFSCSSTYGNDCDCDFDRCVSYLIEEIVDKFGVFDIHDENVLVGEDGKLYLIDLAN